jgi:PIN domain nuclease of toxin-antitoxin system
LERLRKGKEKVFVPAICLTEIAQLHHRGRIQLGMSVSSWFDVALNYPMVELFPLNASVAAEAYSLPGSFHNDPAARMIVASALLLNADLLTDDALIRRYEGVRTP